MVVIEKLASSFKNELSWFQKVVDTRITQYFENDTHSKPLKEMLPPDLSEDDSYYARLITDLKLDYEQRVVLLLALIPHLKPDILDVFLIKNQKLNSAFSEFGGYRDPYKNGFFPTLETACFVLGGSELDIRLNFINKINEQDILYKKGILDMDSEEPFFMRQKLSISPEYLRLFTTGDWSLPQYSVKFPAKEIGTDKDWSDLVVENNVLDDILEIKDWLLYSDHILKDRWLGKQLQPGYRALFYGPPGTGKTIAATLIGKATNRPVFRVAHSMFVSKYIGETEKNVGKLFDEAERKNWILLFDEADALFGKRTRAKEANDRYANQEVAYLLQRIEDFSGLIILTTNTQDNIEVSFSRRFQAIVHFPKPGREQRLKLWEILFKANFELDAEVDIPSLAENYELTGGEMTNVLRYCALQSAKRNDRKLSLSEIMAGIRREYNHQNKTL